MDKLIKINFQNLVLSVLMCLIALRRLDLHKKKHQTLSSSTVALGRTLIANQILAANQKRRQQSNRQSYW